MLDRIARLGPAFHSPFEYPLYRKAFENEKFRRTDRLFHCPVCNDDLPVFRNFLVSVRQIHQRTMMRSLDKRSVSFKIQRSDIKDIRSFLLNKLLEFLRSDLFCLNFLIFLADKNRIIEFPPLRYAAGKRKNPGISPFHRKTCGSGTVRSAGPHTVKNQRCIFFFRQPVCILDFGDRDID